MKYFYLNVSVADEGKTFREIVLRDLDKSELEKNYYFMWKRISKSKKNKYKPRTVSGDKRIRIYVNYVDPWEPTVGSQNSSWTQRDKENFEF